MAKADKGQYKEPGTALKLQPFQDIYLHSNNIYQAGYNKNGNYWTLISLSAIGILILIIACFNFLNLSMAQNSERGVEVGIRKTFGAGQIEIYKQILIENSVFVIISLNISLILVNLFVPWFNNFISKELSLAGALPYIFYFITIVIIFIIICTAFYPSFVLANFETVTVLKGKINLFDSKNWLYKTFHENISKWLVTLQFTISVCLIICALFIIKQLHFIRTFDVGFDKSQIMVIYNTWDGKQDSRFDIIKNMCAQMPEVEMVSSGCNVPTDGYNNSCNPTLLNNPNIKANAGLISVDYNYLSCIGAHLIDGRNFNPLLVSDSSAIIITKSCVKELGLTDPIGEWVENLWDGRKREIVGVVNDINFNTLHIKSQPLIFLAHHKWMTNRTKILIKFKSRNFAIVKSKLEAKWKELCPEEIFGYFFMDDKFEANYHDDNNNAFLINIFTSLSILLCIMGLAGLVMFTVQKRSKEIGIRKVNGANTFEIIGLINKDFLISIAIAFIIGSPIAYYIINLWLRNFAYRTTLDWWVFVFAFAVAMLISIITTSLQSWHVATRNPVESLKYE
jgi:putative ABC transport system permease protein